MADDQKHQALGNAKAAVDRQGPVADPDGHSLVEDSPGKVRSHRPKLSLRYRPRTFATDL